MTTWTTAAVLDWTTKRFTDAGVVGARLEAQVLLAHALGCTRMQLYTGFDRPLGEEELASARGLIKRRLGGEPLAYLVGEQEFWSRTFEVSPDVLIPRSDTETVVQAVLDRLGADKARPRRGLDLCTGSGILAITLARELPGLTMVATDVSTAAAAVATRNVARHQVGERVEVRVGDLWAPVGDEAFDLIVSNPPYIRQAELAGLDREVQREPRLALDGGADGLGFYRRIVAGLAARLAPGGWIAVEHGHDQGPDVAVLLDASGVTAPATTIADLARRPRVTLAARAAGG
ncbi:MAG: peptide chain release factor N(5)-glutamine methyltransferase [Myxococcales bacterium]|nr:peptide chain release factor N(5)-glutamine methyltransferase [Myxococcales bacterium]